MKFLFCSDKFKGSLTSEDIHRILKDSLQSVMPGSESVCVTLADGGEGTMQAVFSQLGGTWITVPVKGPLFKSRQARYLMVDSETAVIEMAEASGLALLSDAKRNPTKTSTMGVGEMILDAIDRGAKTIHLGIGGSATNDAGIGMLAALGYRFLDREGRPLKPTGGVLAFVASIDNSQVDSRVDRTNFHVMCDVNNRLLGKNGATYTYGKQKGADGEMQAKLEEGMKHFYKVVRKMKPEAKDFPGAGAAGGLGYACKVFLNSEMVSGIENILSLNRFDELLTDVDYVVTGEGRIDGQSIRGKCVSGVLAHAKRKGTPVIAIVGGKGEGYEKLLKNGLKEIYALSDSAPSVQEAIENAAHWYRAAADQVFDHIKRLSQE